MTSAPRLADYLWTDASVLRSRKRVVFRGESPTLACFPVASCNGSPEASELRLHPVSCFAGGEIVLCEALGAGGRPHRGNARARLRELLQAGGAAEAPWFGVQQEFVLLERGGTPRRGEPGYCGAGAAPGRDVAETHAQACLDAGLCYGGVRGSAAAGRWQFQLGPRGCPGECADPLRIADQLWVARWLLERVAESAGYTVASDSSSAFVTLSTRATRDRRDGLPALRETLARLEADHARHLARFGRRDADPEFRSAVGERDVSVRIPRHVQSRGWGYLEDRRPRADMDPYVVFRELLQSVSGVAPAPA